MRPAALALLVAEIERGRRTIVELGSGASTVVLARAARRHSVALVSVEHDPGWAAEVRALLRRERLETVAEVIEASACPASGAAGSDRVRGLCLTAQVAGDARRGPHAAGGTDLAVLRSRRRPSRARPDSREPFS